MRYVFRADASQSIGAGHVMRSSAIAEELISRGKEVVFVGKISDLPWVTERIATLGFTHIYENPGDFISNSESDVLLLDSYEILERDNFINLENWCHIVAIVDQSTPDYHCTLRIHPGLDLNWVGNSKVPILAGPKYIPFRSTLSNNMYVKSQELHTIKIAVVAGGSDPYGLVHEITKILVTFPEQFEAYLFSDSILDSTLDSRFRCIRVGQHLDYLTKDIDLILTTASTSSLEFLARGLCVGIVCAVNNQEQYYKSLCKLGVAAQLGFRSINNIWELDNEMIHSLVTSSALRENLIAKAKNLIDFEGASRIVDAITSL
jgi:spore coat polysaccharide biosynthesis predicted glycosyltransferase SpsG